VCVRLLLALDFFRFALWRLRPCLQCVCTLINVSVSFYLVVCVAMLDTAVDTIVLEQRPRTFGVRLHCLQTDIQLRLEQRWRGVALAVT